MEFTKLWNSTAAILQVDDLYSECLGKMREHQHGSTLPPITANVSDEGLIKTGDFLKHHNELSKSDLNEEDRNILVFRSYLTSVRDEYRKLLDHVDAFSSKITNLHDQTSAVMANTRMLEQTSRSLLASHGQLLEVNENILEKLSFYRNYQHLNRLLIDNRYQAGHVRIENYPDVLFKLQNGIFFMKTHPTYKKSTEYFNKHQNFLNIAMNDIKTMVDQVFDAACQDAINASSEEKTNEQIVMHMYYAKFQLQAVKVKGIVEFLEKYDNDDECVEYSECVAAYKRLLTDIKESYVKARMRLVSESVVASLEQIARKHHDDKTMLFRTSCSLLMSVCADERDLYVAFFTKITATFTSYLEQLCVHLYDSLRPFIVHIEHVEILAELCVILMKELTGTQANQPLTDTLTELLKDLQERLVFRCHVYFRTGILDYDPAPGDLAYPDKLHVILDYTNSINQMSASTSRKTSVSEVGSIKSRGHGDMLGMWYPTLRRTLQCLSQLFRCVDLKTFQGLSQECISFCVQSIKRAAAVISQTKRKIDGDLFVIKHLLILREQIATFQVEFQIRETTLDFSHVTHAAVNLLTDKNLFAFNSSNAILTLLLNDTIVKEYTIDSKRDTDIQLKMTCEQFFGHVTLIICGGVLQFNRNVDVFMQRGGVKKDVKGELWGKVDTLATIVGNSKRAIKDELIGILTTIHLYINNSETEAILYRPIKNNIIAAFASLQQHINDIYETEQLSVIGCPSPEQVSLLLSSCFLKKDGLVESSDEK